MPAVDARMDEYDMLTLDDGSAVPVLDDDFITVKPKKPGKTGDVVNIPPSDGVSKECRFKK